MMIYALCRKIDFVENLRVFGVKILTEISIRVKNLTFSMSVGSCVIDRNQTLGQAGGLPGQVGSLPHLVDSVETEPLLNFNS